MSTANHWKKIQLSTGSYAFERPLGMEEEGFYWDTVFNHMGDLLVEGEVEVHNPDCRRRLLSPPDVQDAWLALKERHPLLAATIEERSLDDIHFVVDPLRITSCLPSEATVQKAINKSGVQHILDKFQDAQSPLSTDLLACFSVVEREDDSSRVHVAIYVNHCISDGMSLSSLLGQFLQLVASGSTGPSGRDVSEAYLEDRLSLAIPSEALHPGERTYSAPRKRWRKAIAKVLIENRRRGITGGHTLPRRVTSRTPHTPACSRAFLTKLTTEQTTHILATCKKAGLTFGSVLPILGQIAMARLLFKRYLEGKMNQEEWEFRKAEPVVSAGPINLRPFFDKQWLEKGGATLMSIAVGLSLYQMPHIPLGTAGALKVGSALMPDHLAMLSKERFMHRARVMKREVAEYLGHPLFLEMGESGLKEMVQRKRGIATAWRERGVGEDQGREMTVQEQASDGGFVVGHGGASLGNLEHILPTQYPIKHDGVKPPALELVEVKPFIHSRPAQVYLLAATFRKQMEFHVFWDVNVYDKDIIQDWLEELVSSTIVYLT